MKNKVIVLASVLILLGAVIYVVADPVGPTNLTSGASSRANIATGPKNISAQAGNVTELNITAIGITQSWQGYFGAITAEIVLADSSNNQFYNWSVTTPSGEVYASPNSSVSWGDIKCFNYTDSTGNINLSVVEQNWFNIPTTSADGINETFNLTSHIAFDVGSTTISANSCPSTYVFNNSGYQTTDFSNVLLTDNSSLVFTGLIENDANGFDASTYDYQLLVAEDGHGSASSSTTLYYFWVEIS